MSQLDTLIVKFASPCNLACTYCYEYALGDETWRQKPKQITEKTIHALTARIVEYGETTGTKEINIVAHGGEPLLLGHDKLDKIFSMIRSESAPVNIRFSLQTNGILLSPKISKLLARHEVTVGVSLDGGETHNKRRVDHKGRSTYDRVISGIQNLALTPGARFGGILCVIDLQHDPNEIINQLCSLNPTSIDLLQPFISHDFAADKRVEIANNFGDWMCRAMHAWISEPKFSKIRIRVLEDALKASITRKPTTDWFGPRNISYLVIETDGNYDLLDQLKAIGPTSSLIRYLGRNLYDCSLDEATGLARRLLAEFEGDKLPDDCEKCRWNDVCAGGHLPARYSEVKKFNNRSVYCEGIFAIFEYAHQKMSNQLDQVDI